MPESKNGKIDIERYRVKEGEKISLKDFPTACDVKIEKAEVKERYFPETIEKLKVLQEKLYAQNTYGLIIVLQAMDAAGKDGTVNHVFASLNPGGVKVVSFKQPTSEEKDHDYMWRINKALPERGNIGIFNRSQYEDVIVTRIHDLIHQGQLPQDLIHKDIWEERYEQITNWEKYLAANGFPMVKIFLHVSKEEQQKRLMDRIFNQQKNWKFSMADMRERQYWDQYQEIYGEMISKTSKDYAPWYIVPADNKWYTRYVDIGAAGKDLGEVIGIGHNGMTLDKTLEEAFAKGKPDVIVDFTSPKVIYENAKYVLENGVNIVIGTTGLTAKQREELAGIAEKTGANGLVAPNFSLGAVLLMKVSAEISKYMPNAEIIELHHNHKYDAPSGTAKLTAEKMAAARTMEPEADETKESLPGVRGGKYEGITIHSVRLPGYVAHQEVLFGGYGEILTLRHDSLDRKSFMPGVMLACKKCMTVKGFVYGLENYLE